MKNNLFFCLSVISSLLLSQVGINTDNPDSSAALDIQSNSKKGILIPRVRLTSTLDNTNNPATGLLVYNTITQNDVRENNFYYYDGNKWNPILSGNDRAQLENAIQNVLLNSQNLKIPILTRIDQLTTSYYLTRLRQSIRFDTNILKRDDLITYSDGTYTVQQDGVYCITLQVGIKDYKPGVDIIIGLTDEEWQWIGRTTFHGSEPIKKQDYTPQEVTKQVEVGTNRGFHVYTTFLKFKKGAVFHAAVHVIESRRVGVIVEGIQTGTTGNGNITNISIVKY